MGLSLPFLEPLEKSFSPAGRVETGRYCEVAADVCGLPPRSNEGRGPNFTFGFPFDPYDE